MEEKVICSEPGCENLILRSTASDTGGRCMPCKNKKESEAREADLKKNKKKVDRFAGITDRVEILKLLANPPKFDPLFEYVPYPQTKEQIYSELSPEQLDEYSKYINELIKSGAEDAEDLAGELAAFTNAELTEIQLSLIEKEEFYPDIIFRNATPEVREAIIQLLKSSDPSSLSLNSMLPALAWIGGKEIVQLFREWRENPPSWSSEFYIEPHNFSKSAGWVHTEESSRKLFLEPCYGLKRTDTDSEDSITLFEDQPDDCPWCNQKLVTLMNLPLEKLNPITWELGFKKVEITTCQICTCYETVYCNLNSEGSSEWSQHNQRPDYLPDDADDWERYPKTQMKLNPSPRLPYTASNWLVELTKTQIGGLPGWIQDEAFPCCPKCSETMVFIGQISNEDIEDYAEGIFYIFLCSNCKIGATNYQQT